MTRRADLLIIGAGPAGMSAAIAARRYGLDVLVVDEQPAPGGQIWRGIEQVAQTARAEILGEAYLAGLDVAKAFRASGARYEPGTQVWQLEKGPRAFMTREGVASAVDADAILLATGAQERPVPFPGWTLPGVMTVGAGQILLKSSDQIPDAPVWIAGSGPLPLLYAIQLLKAGGQIAGYLDTTPKGRAFAALPQLAKALAAPAELAKGLSWLTTLKRQTRYIGNVSGIEAHGSDRLEQITFTTRGGKTETVDAEMLLVHEGVIPTIHPTLALGCEHDWNRAQDCYAPKLDAWGETTETGVYVAGDGAGIGGAIAACHRGELAAIGIAAKAGRLTAQEAESAVQPIRAALAKALKIRPFLDTYYRPRKAVFSPPDKALACRCEEVTAQTVRTLAANGYRDPNQIKTFTRAGMGPCQGRQCNYTVAAILAEATGKTVPDLGLYRVRPPFKPLTLGELSGLDVIGEAS